MIIINADDWGGWKTATDAALTCYRAGRITSVSAMLFMQDSERAATLAKESGVDVGLHLNLNQGYDGPVPSSAAARAQAKLVRFMGRGKYAQLLYHPGLRNVFRDVFESQSDEFLRLYGQAPSHVNGHQHRHLCSNMLIDRIIPAGQKVRRSFSFWPGEKGLVNRCYRLQVDKRLRQRYCVTDFFFSLGQCLQHQRMARVAELAKAASVELMTHPEKPVERAFLLSDACLGVFAEVAHGTYTLLDNSNQAQQDAPKHRLLISREQ